MTFEQLEYFLKAAKYQNLSKAAKELFVSHSALSKSIAALEEELDATLFARDKNTLRLTPAGRYLVEQGKYIQKLWHNTKQQIHFIENSVQGTITLCMPPLYETRIFSILSEIGLRHPEINFIFNNIEPLRIINALQNNQADIGIGFSYLLPTDTEEYEYKNLFEDSFCVIANQTHPLAQKDVVSLEDLQHECIIFPPKVGTINTDMALLGKVVEPNFINSYKADGLEDVFFQIGINRGVSILPKSTMLGRNLNFKLLPISDILEPFYICLIWKKANKNSLLPLITEALLSKFS